MANRGTPFLVKPALIMDDLPRGKGVPTPFLTRTSILYGRSKGTGLNSPDLAKSAIFLALNSKLEGNLIRPTNEYHSLMLTTNLAFEEWTEIFGSERLTGALLDRLTHQCHILEASGESYRLRQARKKSN
jgi:IstB-like ATP binding protein